jgi:hypothetical protein
MLVIMATDFLHESLAVLERTPGALQALLHGLPEAWTLATEGEGTWSPYIVIGHLIHCEKADWMPRVRMILEHGRAKAFEPLDREAQFRAGSERDLAAMLEEFRVLRAANLVELRSMSLGDTDLEREGIHPAFGKVTLRQLLATWTAHDMAHVVQIARTMAKRYREEVGPWAEYLSVMR